MKPELTKTQLLALHASYGTFSARQALLFERVLNYGVLVHASGMRYVVKCGHWHRVLSKAARRFEHCSPSVYGEIMGRAYGQAMADLE